MQLLGVYSLEYAVVRCVQLLGVCSLEYAVVRCVQFGVCSC